MAVPRQLAAVCVTALAATTVGSSAAATSGHPRPPGAAAAAPGDACSPSTVLDRMSQDQQIGQLFMVGTPAASADATALAAVTSRHIGNIMLTGRSTGGTAVPARTVTAFKDRVTAASTSSVPLLVSTDQEGGYVQVLQGSGFDAMPTALTQGGWSSATLRSRAQRWAGQLKAAGVNQNLAPVADTSPAGIDNPPIGYYHRQYGYHSDRETRAVHDVLVGEQDAGHLAVTGKHFPGLGLVSGNTDTTANVTDNTITRTAAYIDPYKQLIKDGVPAMMMSSARYTRIDPAHLAVFSPSTISWLRSLGFDGVVMTDDFGNAKAITKYTYRNRVDAAFDAGVDLILTVNPATVGPMYDVALATARSDPAFAAKLHAAALRVLTMKARFGLLPGC